MNSKVSSEHSGLRLDVYVAQVASSGELSRKQARKLCLEGQVRVNTRVQTNGYIVNCGELVEIELRELTEIVGQLNVVFENKRFLVVEKPRGLHSVRQFNSIEQTLEDLVAAREDSEEEISLAVKDHGLIQRLDYWTSGLILVAKSASSEEMLRALLLKKQIHKTYLAWVEGIPRKDTYTIEAAIDAQNKQKVIISDDGVPAKSKIKVVYRNEKNNTALLRVSGDTMHRHQVRAHAAFIRHPLVGDSIYSEQGDSQGGFYLHAESISFVVPETQKRSSWESSTWKNWDRISEVLSEVPENIEL